MNQLNDHNGERGDDENITPREWFIFVLVGVPIIGLLTVARSLLLEDDSLNDAIEIAIIVAALTLVGTLFALMRGRR